MAKKDIHLNLTEEVCNDIKFLAYMEGSSRSALINDILIAFINRNEKELEEFKRVVKKFNNNLKW